MTTTLVTGGTGFIGSHVAAELRERGREVLLLDHMHRHPTPGMEVLYGDIRDPIDVMEAMAHADSWIHLAGVLGTAETVQDPRPAAVTNILGGLNVLEAAAHYNVPGVNIAVGNYWMNNPYSITKNTVERFCDMYRRERGVPVTVVRALNAYGPGQVPAAPYGPSKVRKITPAFVCRALTDTPIEIYGDGSQVMDMIHVDDVAIILVNALEVTERKGPIETVIEAGTGRETTVLDIAQLVAAEVAAQTDMDPEITFLPMRAGEPERSVVLGNPGTLAAVGVDPKALYTLEDGLSETVAWYRENWLPAYLAS